MYLGSKIVLAILLGLLFVGGFLGFSTSLAQAESVATSASVAVESNPVLINQDVVINVRVEPSSPKDTEYISGLNLFVTQPDGASDRLGPFMAYPNGTAKVPYTPGQIGTYTFQLNYSGQFFKSANVTYAPSQSQKISLIVVQTFSTPRPVPTVSPIPTIQPPLVLPYEGNSKVITVPDDFPTITLAINNSNNGDTVYVKSGTYSEPAIIVNQTITIIGQNAQNTIINNIDKNAIVEWLGGYLMPFGPTYGLRLNAPNVRISGFTIRNASTGIAILGDGSQIVGNIIEGFDYVNGFEIGVNVSSSNAQISGNLISGAAFGVLAEGSNQKIMGNIFVSMYNSLSLSCDYSRISGNTIFGEGVSGMNVFGNCNLLDNNTLVNQSNGIEIYSNGNVVLRNKIEHGSNGILVESNSATKQFWGNNLICGNTISLYNYGIMIMNGQNNIVCANDIVRNDYGISVLRNQSWLMNQTNRQTWQTSYNNTFYHNNFIENGFRQANDWSWEGVNFWDNGKEGNYWSSFITTDTNSDGKGDESYHVNSPYLLNITTLYKNQLQDPGSLNLNAPYDHYTLMSPFITQNENLTLPEWAIALLTPTQMPSSTPTTYNPSPSPNLTSTPLSKQTQTPQPSRSPSPFLSNSPTSLKPTLSPTQPASTATSSYPNVETSQIIGLAIGLALTIVAGLVVYSRKRNVLSFR